MAGRSWHRDGADMTRGEVLRKSAGLQSRDRRRKSEAEIGDAAAWQGWRRLMRRGKVGQTNGEAGHRRATDMHRKVRRATAKRSGVRQWMRRKSGEETGHECEGKAERCADPVCAGEEEFCGALRRNRFAVMSRGGVLICGELPMKSPDRNGSDKEMRRLAG